MKRHNSVKTLLGALIVSAAGLALIAPVHAGDRYGDHYDDEYSHHFSHKRHSHKGHKKSRHVHDRHHHHHKYGHRYHGHSDRYCKRPRYPRQTHYNRYDSYPSAWDFIVRYHFND